MTVPYRLGAARSGVLRDDEDSTVIFSTPRGFYFMKRRKVFRSMGGSKRIAQLPLPARGSRPGLAPCRAFASLGSRTPLCARVTRDDDPPTPKRYSPPSSIPADPPPSFPGASANFRLAGRLATPISSAMSLVVSPNSVSPSTSFVSNASPHLPRFSASNHRRTSAGDHPRGSPSSRRSKLAATSSSAWR